MSNGQFDNKVALVTGGASGIGRATALAFAKDGAEVVVADIEVSGGQDTVQLIRSQGASATFVQVDVSQPDQVTHLFEQIVKQFGSLDFAHNNAGILGELTPITESSKTNWDHVLSVNLTGVWLCMQAELRLMLKQNSGVIVNTSSLDGLVGARNRSAYVASKHGIVGLTKAGALEVAHAGIRVNAVCPAAVKTPMRTQVTGDDPEIEARVDAFHPLGRQAQPEEIAQTVIWLCSESASFITGQAIAVDGGVSAF